MTRDQVERLARRAEKGLAAALRRRALLRMPWGADLRMPKVIAHPFNDDDVTVRLEIDHQHMLGEPGRMIRLLPREGLMGYHVEHGSDVRWAATHILRRTARERVLSRRGYVLSRPNANGRHVSAIGEIGEREDIHRVPRWSLCVHPLGRQMIEARHRGLLPDDSVEVEIVQDLVLVKGSFDVGMDVPLAIECGGVYAYAILPEGMLPETVLQSIAGRRFSDIVSLPACGVDHVDAAVARLTVPHRIPPLGDGEILSLNRTRWMPLSDPPDRRATAYQRRWPMSS